MFLLIILASLAAHLAFLCHVLLSLQFLLLFLLLDFQIEILDDLVKIRELQTDFVEGRYNNLSFSRVF